MVQKLSAQNAESGCFFQVFFTHLITSYMSESVRCFPSPIYRKFAVECDWKIFSKHAKFGALPKKNDRFFWKKTDFFFKIGKDGKFAVDYVLSNIIS